VSEELNLLESIQEFDFIKVTVKNATREWKCLAYQEFLMSHGPDTHSDEGREFFFYWLLQPT
jgi:hypothetical protein